MLYIDQRNAYEFNEWITLISRVYELYVGEKHGASPLDVSLAKKRTEILAHFKNQGLKLLDIAENKFFYWLNLENTADILKSIFSDEQFYELWEMKSIEEFEQEYVSKHPLFDNQRVKHFWNKLKTSIYDIIGDYDEMSENFYIKNQQIQQIWNNGIRRDNQTINVNIMLIMKGTNNYYKK